MRILKDIIATCDDITYQYSISKAPKFIKDINAKNNKGNTALDYITGGNLKIIQCLLKHDAKESIPSTEEPKSERGSQK